jgi:hypothetical protein
VLTLAAPAPPARAFRQTSSPAPIRAAASRGKQPGDVACVRCAEQTTVAAAELRAAFLSHL